MNLIAEPRVGDALGATLEACLARGAEFGQVFEIVERDDGFIAAGDAARYFHLVGDDRARWVLDRLRGRLLDVGAGGGKWALAAIELGHQAVALDISEGAIAVCERRGIAATFQGTVGDLLRTRPEPFGTLLLLGNNVGILGPPETARPMLESMARLTERGGVLIAEGLDAPSTGDPDHVRYHAWNEERGRPRGLIRMRLRFRSLATEWFDYLMPPLDDFLELLSGLPWSLEDVRTDGANYLALLRRH